jgi:hypothetical protein
MDFCIRVTYEFHGTFLCFFYRYLLGAYCGGLLLLECVRLQEDFGVFFYGEG